MALGLLTSELSRLDVIVLGKLIVSSLGELAEVGWALLPWGAWSQRCYL